MNNNNNLDDVIDDIIDNELNSSNVNKYISKVHPDLDLKYNSLNIAVGKPGTSKTTTFMKTMMKLANYPNTYHMIIYVSDLDSDDTMIKLMKYITIPIFQVSYSDFIEKFEALIKQKQLYWKAKREKNNVEIKQLANVLFLKKPIQNVQTMIFCDDAGWVFDKKSPINKYLCKLRHLQCTFWLNVQIWKSIDPSVKSLITSAYICKGFSRQQLQNIYRQLSVDGDFNTFARKYSTLQCYDKLFIDNQDSILKIVS